LPDELRSAGETLFSGPSHDHSSEIRQGQQEYLAIKLTDVMVSATILRENSGDSLSESVSLAFAKVAYEYKPQKADGSLDAGLHFKYDIKGNKEG